MAFSKRFAFIYSLLNEYLFQRGVEQLLLELTPTDFEFAAEQALCAVYAVAEDIADSKELWLVILNDTAVWGNIYLAVGERVKG